MPHPEIGCRIICHLNVIDLFSYVLVCRRWHDLFYQSFLPSKYATRYWDFTKSRFLFLQDWDVSIENQHAFMHPDDYNITLRLLAKHLFFIHPNSVDTPDGDAVEQAIIDNLCDNPMRWLALVNFLYRNMPDIRVQFHGDGEHRRWEGGIQTRNETVFTCDVCCDRHAFSTDFAATNDGVRIIIIIHPESVLRRECIWIDLCAPMAKLAIRKAANTTIISRFVWHDFIQQHYYNAELGYVRWTAESASVDKDNKRKR